MNNNAETKTSFWNFIKNNNIEIPIIQRDYAQGRNDKETIREQFISYLKDALRSSVSGQSEPYILDFVYGSKPQDSILPLDGQQRLTTLWLLHWYFAYKNGVSPQNAEIFGHFSYETRESSRNFIQRLIELLKTERKSAGTQNSTEDVQSKISDVIKNNLWFLREWNNDQTISSMLVMLDYIDEVFKDAPIEKYWQNLTSDDAPIMFFELKLENFGLTDDLYIKMNARGKSLTSFENFKADLVGYLKEKDEAKAEEISLKLDTSWTDIFWRNRSSSRSIDEIYFAFLNRWFFGEWCAFCAKSPDDIDKDNKIQSALYGSNRKVGDEKEIDDSKICYGKFDVYKEILDNTPFLIEKLEKTLDNFSDFWLSKSFKNENIQRKFYPVWDSESEFEFIPTYSKNEKSEDVETEDFGKNKILAIQKIDQMERPVFFAICKYFEHGKYEEDSFNRWLRFAWNLSSDPRLRDTSAMIQVTRKINDYANNSHTIYEKLAKVDVSSFPHGTVLNDQFIEECEKTQAILCGKVTEKEIIEAERTAFFKGQIRFLYKNENNELDWDNFSKKLKNARIVFVKDGITSDYKIPLTKALVKTIHSWNQIYNKTLFLANSDTWRDIMIRGEYKEQVNLLLSTQPTELNSIKCSKQFECQYDDERIAWEKIAESKLIDYLITEHPDYRLHWYTRLAFYRNRSFSYPVVIDWGNFKRAEILSELEDQEEITVFELNKTPDCHHYVGEHIDFSYKKQNFQWFLKNGDTNIADIYMMNDKYPEEDGYDYLPRATHRGKRSNDDHKEYYCFDYNEDMTAKDFLKGLNSLIKEKKENN